MRTIKDKSFRFYDVNSSDLSEVWCLKENENAILNRTEKVMVRAMCGQKIVDKKTEEQMNMLGLKETIFEFLLRLVIGLRFADVMFMFPFESDSADSNLS